MTAQTPLPPRPLQVSGLTVARDGRTLFSDLAFTIEPGGVLLVRGPNGAGKSSLLLALAGILRPEAGRIETAAGDERPGTALHFLGHLNAVKPRLSLAENLKFWMDLYDASVVSLPLEGRDQGRGSFGQQRAAEGPSPPAPPLRGEGSDPTAISAALAAVGLPHLDDNDAGHLSQGQTRRLALARLVALPRPIWLLDEPTAALDARGDDLVARLIRDHRAAGGIAVIATHHDLDVGPVETLTLGAS
jgi:heme exporter protein A